MDCSGRANMVRVVLVVKGPLGLIGKRNLCTEVWELAGNGSMITTSCAFLLTTSCWQAEKRANTLLAGVTIKCDAAFQTRFNQSTQG